MSLGTGHACTIESLRNPGGGESNSASVWPELTLTGARTFTVGHLGQESVSSADAVAESQSVVLAQGEG